MYVCMEACVCTELLPSYVWTELRFYAPNHHHPHKALHKARATRGGEREGASESEKNLAELNGLGNISKVLEEESKSLLRVAHPRENKDHLAIQLTLLAQRQRALQSAFSEKERAQETDRKREQVSLARVSESP